jgi:hypothetical protein
MSDMARIIVIFLALAFAAVASAQEPKAIKTVKVTQSLNVKDDGTVLIDWAEVEALAASKQNPILTPQAQVMLAIRDGKVSTRPSRASFVAVTTACNIAAEPKRRTNLPSMSRAGP